MTGLETTFYIVALVYMGLMFLIMIALLVAILAIRAKIHALQEKITDTVATATRFMSGLSPLLTLVRRFTHR